MIVLHVGERLLQSVLVMIVHQRDGAGDLPALRLLLMLNEVIANHVSDGQRTVGIAFLVHHAVELPHQLSRQRHTEPDRTFIFARHDRHSNEPAVSVNDPPAVVPPEGRSAHETGRLEQLQNQRDGRKMASCKTSMKIMLE
jgi:hypothetical protein